MISAGIFASMMNQGDTPPPSPGAERRVTKEVFGLKATVTYNEVQPAALVDFDDRFDTTAFTTFNSTATPLTTAVSGGKLQVTNPTAVARDVFIQEGSAVLMPQAFYYVDIDSMTMTGGTYNVIGVGFAKDVNNWFYAEYDYHNQILRLEYKSPTAMGFINSTPFIFTAPFSLAISVVGNSVTVYTGVAGVWTARITNANPFTLKSKDLANWKASMLFSTNGITTNVIDRWKCGRYGGVGIRDLTCVTDEAGNPHIVAGKVYMTATIPDHSGSSWCGVVRVDLSTYAIETVAAIMIARGTDIQNDVAAHIIQYPDNTSRLCISTWGNGFGGSLQILHKRESVDLLNGSHVVSGMTQFVMPNVLDADDGVYDPQLMKDGSTWLLAYSFTERTDFSGSPFYACLASSPDLVTWTVIGADSANKGYEGTKFLRYEDGTYVVTAGGPSAYRVYNSTMTFIGNLNAATNGLGRTQPHAAIVPYQGFHHLITFNGAYPSGITASFTWGQLEASRTPRYKLDDPTYLADGLDVFPATMWGLRRLTEFYSGACIRVQVGLTTTQADIGFDSSGEVDQSAMLALLAANPGATQLRVVKVYDQGAIGRDLNGIASGSSASGPLIYNSGFVLQAGRPAMDQANGTGFNTVDNTRLLKRDYAISALARNDVTNTGTLWYQMSGLVFSEYAGVVNDFAFGKMGTLLTLGQGNSSVDFATSGTTAIGGALRQLGVARNLASKRVRLYVDNVKQTDVVTPQAQTEHTSSAALTFHTQWTVQEILLWAFEPTDADLALVTADQDART